MIEKDESTGEGEGESKAKGKGKLAPEAKAKAEEAPAPVAPAQPSTVKLRNKFNSYVYNAGSTKYRFAPAGQDGSVRAVPPEVAEYLQSLEITTYDRHSNARIEKRFELAK